MNYKNKTQNESLKGKGTNHVLESPLITKNILKRKNDEKPKGIISLEKPSPTTMTHLKIKGNLRSLQNYWHFLLIDITQNNQRKAIDALVENGHFAIGPND